MSGRIEQEDRARKMMEEKLCKLPEIFTAFYECESMKMVTLENIVACLESESPEILLDEATRSAAEKAILNMVAIKQSK